MKRLLIITAILAQCVVLAGTDTNTFGPANKLEANGTIDATAIIGPGDRIMYQVMEDQDAPVSLTITDTGDLEAPYYGLVHAGGKTCRQLATELKSLLERRLYSRATVVIALEVANKTLVTGKVYVTGQVRNPGGYPIQAGDNLTASKAILGAGGFSDFSDKKRVRLIRKSDNKEQTFVINVVEVWNGHLDKDVVVQPGDLIVVPARLVNY